MTRSRRGGAGRRRATSQRWLARQRRDPFARRAQLENKVSRAHYKLQQLDERFRLLRPGMTVLELGAAPGGWTRYVEARLGAGVLIACDVLPVRAGASTVVVEGRVGESDVDEAIDAVLGGGKVDLVLSDMAPNITGIRAADQARTVELAELAVQAAGRWLTPGGDLVVKLFQGEGVDSWTSNTSNLFAIMRMVKPSASRRESREVYAVGQQFLVTG